MTFGENLSSPSYTLINGHKFVDLGLPSGLLWAKTNVGAFSSSGDGDYFAWSETSPKTIYSWSTYKWGSNPSKYNSSDGKTTLDAEDDAASVNWGLPCRMPSSSEFQELYDKCDWLWKSNYGGTRGFLVTGPNGRSIFIPASGYRNDDDLVGHSLDGYYWSCSLDAGYTYYARGLYFLSGSISSANNDARSYGVPVRPVAEK